MNRVKNSKSSEPPEGSPSEWVQQARRLLQQRGLKGTQKEIAEALGMSQPWVAKYDPITHQEHPKVLWRNTFFGYNVWGFKDESWRQLIIPGDPNQPDKEGYHGHTPSFVIHQLVKMFEPKTMLDSMAGVEDVTLRPPKKGVNSRIFVDTSSWKTISSLK